MAFHRIIRELFRLDPHIHIIKIYRNIWTKLMEMCKNKFANANVCLDNVPIIKIFRFLWCLGKHVIQPVLLYIMHYCHLALNISHNRHAKGAELKYLVAHFNKVNIHKKCSIYKIFLFATTRPTTSLSVQIPIPKMHLSMYGSKSDILSDWQSRHTHINLTALFNYACPYLR